MTTSRRVVPVRPRKSDALTLNATSRPPAGYAYCWTNRPSTIVHLRGAGYDASAVHLSLCRKDMHSWTEGSPLNGTLCRQCAKAAGVIE
jgi:hypothetical protein